MGYSDVSKTSPVYGADAVGIPPTFSGCASGIAPAYSGCARGGDVPTITSIAPGSMKAGLVVPITINGSFLSNVTSVLITPNTLILVTNINVVNDNQLIVTFTLDAAAAEGVRQIAVVTPLGTSNAVDITILPGMWLGITTEPSLWLEADYGVVDANNAGMTQWNDRSSNANHMTVVPTKSAPIYKSSGWAGAVSRPYWQFNDAHACQTPVSSAFSLTSHTVFVVFQRDPADGNSVIIFHVADVIGFGIQDKAASSYVARFNAPHTVVLESSYHNTFGWLPLNSRVHLRAEYGGTHATHKLFLSNAQQLLTNQLVNDPGLVPTIAGRVYLGFRDVSLPAFDLLGRIAVAVVYKNLLSPADIATVHGQIHTKWMS